MNPTLVAPEGRTRVLLILAVALVLSMSTWFSASAVIPQLRDEWRLTDATAAWLTIAVQLGFVAGAVLSSMLNLSDVLPVRSIMIVSSVGAAGVNLLLLLADGPFVAIPLRFLTGAFLAGLYPPALKLMATWFTTGRGTALGVMVGALTLGSALPHLVNALGGLDWPTVITATSVATVVGALIVWALVREGPFPFPQAVFDMRQARLAFGNRTLRLAALAYFGHMWELYAMWAWFLVFFRASLAVNGSQDGAFAAAATFAVIGIGAIGCYAGGLFADRWGRARLNLWSLSVSGGCAVIIGFTFGRATWIVLVVALVWGLAVVADSAQYSTLVTEHADQRYVGTALTLQLAGGFLLTVVTIWLIPAFESAVSWRWAFLLLVPGPLVGIEAMRRLATTADGDAKSSERT
ncbi:MAG: MFS transporter [Actinomycetota bacterium]|nr:MFS transporter [Actinomycetota bacterium]